MSGYAGKQVSLSLILRLIPILILILILILFQFQMRKLWCYRVELIFLYIGDVLILVSCEVLH